jgi:nicotinamidase-related amidase
LLIDYQQNMFVQVFERDRRLVELNVRTVATAALAFKIPAVLSTVGVKMGVNDPTIPSLQAALPNVKEIDLSSMDAWEDPAFLDAVKATGGQRLVMGGAALTRAPEHHQTKDPGARTPKITEHA